MPPAIIWVAKPTGFLLPFRDIGQLDNVGYVLRGQGRLDQGAEKNMAGNSYTVEFSAINM